MRMILRHHSSKSGQAIVEAIVAVSILTTGFLGIITLLSRSLGLNRTVSENYIATYLAAEGIEVVKNIIDANAIQKKPWNSGFANGTYEVQYDTLSLRSAADRPLLLDPVSGLYSYDRGTVATPFKRSVSIELLGRDEVKASAVVSWTSRGGGRFEVGAEDHFLNWRP